jgi:hypothetical protein
MVTVLVPGSWGDIYIDEEFKGRTGEVSAISVPPGTHTLRVENDLALTWSRRFEVAPGEPLVVEVTGLERKPSRVRFPAELDGECSVHLDENARGTLASLGYSLRIREPDIPHRLTISCPDQAPTDVALKPALPGSTMALSLAAFAEQ